MCGIAEFVFRNEHRDLREAGAVLETMCRVIAHRGSGEQGTPVNDRVQDRWAHVETDGRGRANSLAERGLI